MADERLAEVYKLNASLKGCVFSDFLNKSTDLAVLMFTGRIFHSFGAATMNALSPALTNLDLGTYNFSLSSDDLRDRVCLDV